MKSIEFINVDKSFGEVQALNKLNLKIEEGEVYALLGHNGAGKTTTLRMILGLLERDAGSISVFGVDPEKEGDLIRNMSGVLSENVGLYEPLTAYENLRYYAEIYGMEKKQYDMRIDELLKQFSIFEKKHLPVKGFSLGMKKKVALIRALLHKPKLLLLDEPTSGLDPVSTIELRNMLKKMVSENKITIILTTHNLEEAQKLCSKVSIFRYGKNVFTQEVEALKKEEKYMEDGQFSLEKLYMEIESEESKFA